MPNITPHISRHTYCSNMEKSGMNSKTLQYLMGHSNIGVTLNTYTHLSLEDAEDELKRLEDLQNAQKELERTQGRSWCRKGCYGNLIWKNDDDLA